MSSTNPATSARQRTHAPTNLRTLEPAMPFSRAAATLLIPEPAKMCQYQCP